MQTSLFSKNLKYDIPAGVVVFLIAVPLCLGIALASGAPLFAGMISGIIGGLVVGMISGSHTSVSGPAAGLVAVVVAAVHDLGSFEAFLMTVVLAGVLQLILGVVRAGGIADYLPSNVIKGMLSAIGIIIILKQIPHALGYDQDAEGDFSFVEADGSNTFSSIVTATTDFLHPGAIIITLLSLGIMIGWDRSPLKRLIPTIPSALVAVIFAILTNEVFKMIGEPFVIMPEHLVQIPVADSLSEWLSLFTLPDFSQWANPQVYIVALTICAVASVETLLCIEAVDNIDPHKRYSNPNLELRAQGVGNIISGLIGGLPITSVIVRSSANVNANAQTKISAIFHGILLLVCVALIPHLLNMIPLASLAAILILVGYKLAKVSIFRQMWSEGPYQWWPFIITIVAIIFTDLLVGVGIGLAASVFAILRHNLSNPYRLRKIKHQDEEWITIKIAEEVSFLNKGRIKLRLEGLADFSKVIIDTRENIYLDHDVKELFEDFINVQAPERNIEVHILRPTDTDHTDQEIPNDVMKAIERRRTV
jgi:MFS superfamily sulfate permease-like transporter